MTKKIILSIGLLLFLSFVGGVIYIKTNLNAIVKSAMEKYGSEMTQTRISIDDVDIALATGEGSVSGIHVSNPKSFYSPNAIQVGKISLQLDTSTVTGDGPVIIKTVNIDSPKVIYEVNASGDANLDTLQKNMKGGKSTNTGSSSSGPSRKVIIQDLYIRNGDISIVHGLLKGRALETPLPTIHLKNIGADGSGVTPEVVASQVLGEIARSASKAGSAALTSEIPELKKIGSDAVGEAADSIKKSLGGLFGQ